MNYYSAIDDFKKRPVWAEINLDMAVNNIKNIRDIVRKDVLVVAVVKGNAYGHGAVQLSKIFLANGADMLAVSSVDEAIELRLAGLSCRIMILGHSDGRREKEIVEYELEPAVYRLEDAALFSQEAVKANKKINVHIAVDTGMGRIGFQIKKSSIETVKKISMLEGIQINSAFTHFAVADSIKEEDIAFTKLQFERFKSFRNSLEKAGVSIPNYQCCNSAATFDYRECWCNMVRPGISLYGYNPLGKDSSAPDAVKAVMSLRCCISNIKEVQPGDTIGYGRTFKTEKVSRIATLPIGYSDGFPRCLSNKAVVLVNGHKARQVGNICMDQCMVDVSDIPDAKIGDEVVIFGEQNGETVRLDDLAAQAGTIWHEILCNINRRVPRVYVQNGELKGRVEYLLDK